MINTEYPRVLQIEGTFHELENVMRVLKEPHPLTGSVNSRKWRAALCGATDIVDIDKDHAKAVQLLPFWIDYLQARAMTGVPTPQVAHALGTCLHMIVQYGLLGHINKSAEQSRILAWTCLTRFHAADKNRDEKTAIITLLNHWSCKQCLDIEASEEQVVELLYGPAVWDLYRNDVEDLTELPGYLYNLGLELNIAKSAKNPLGELSALPINII